MPSSPLRFVIFLTTSAVLACALLVTYVSLPPQDFPTVQTDVHIGEEMSLSRVASQLSQEHIIRSPFLYKVATYLVPGHRSVLAGDYRFTKPVSVWEIAYRISNGDQGLPKIKVTIPEGTNVRDMTLILMNKIPGFNGPQFYGQAQKYEGYLFPDTYFFLSNVKPETVIQEMRDTFVLRTKDLESSIRSFKYNLKDIVTMASLVEEEAHIYEDRRIVSGILWKRLERGMLLQVDPPFYYITGKTGTVTYDDLKIDSPYNTYKYKGLPQGPISNPGLEAFKATLNPISTPYFFYLTGKDGKMYYAETYEGHLRNKNNHLR